MQKQDATERLRFNDERKYRRSSTDPNECHKRTQQFPLGQK